VEDFLYSLAEMKYRMYHELFKFRLSANTDKECFERIKYLMKYEQTVNIINMLPVDQKNRFREIESEYFSDAPYV
jgi:hypothetical protein